MATATAAGISSLANKGDLVFQAGRYSKVGGLRTLKLADLRHATKAENISGLLDLGIRENRVDPIQAIQLRRVYQSVAAGDELLLTCLRHATCQPEVFIRIQGMSRLHADVIRRSPGLSIVRANQEVGALTERLMHRFFQGSGWTRVQGEVGRQGIDGLYVKWQKGVVRDVLIAESKYNTSVLQPTNHGTQMSSDWVARKVANLQAQSPGDPVYTAIRKFVDNGSYRAVLWQLKVDESAISVSLTKLIGKGREVTYMSDNVVDGLPALPLSPIKFGNPASKFESEFLHWFRDELDAIGSLLH